MRSILYLTILLYIPTAHAEKEVPDFDYVAKHQFWGELYTYGGWTLYCGFRFKEREQTVTGAPIKIEHIFSAAGMLKHAGCDSRMQCREQTNELFIRMEADMHNMYPVIQAIITPVNNPSYGDIAGEDWKFDDCDYEKSGSTMEPRPVARGNVARSMLYMHLQYGVRLDQKLLDTLLVWNREDPPSRQEKLRNDKIEILQGRRNPYIDDPTLADLLIVTGP